MTGATTNSHVAATMVGRKVLFVAAATLDIATILKPPLADFEVVRSRGTAETLALVISGNFSHVIVDLSFDDEALALLVPLLASSEHDFRLYVVATRNTIGSYLRIRGVDRVFAGGDVERQIRAALCASSRPADKPAHAAQIGPAAVELEERVAVNSLLKTLRNRFTATVSALYKNTAFVLLAILFGAFCFYGLLIAYFLVSSGWGAPVTLSRGHELVTKVEQQLSDMRVNANLISQRSSEAELESSEAARARTDAGLLVAYVTSTIEGEISARRAKRQSLAAAVSRQQRLKSNFEKELNGSGLSAKLRRLYGKRIIDRRTMESNTLGLLEASQRMSAIETELATAADDLAALDTTLKMLGALRLYVSDGTGQPPSAASADLLLLTKQAVDARSALSQSEVQLASAQSRLTLLASSAQLLHQRIDEVEASPLGRAINQRIDVIFVPYGHESHFKPQAPLYSCRLTFIFCRNVGIVGDKLPGEANTVHPFFGKPIRGYFVEALLTDESAASEDIIHAGRPPFFF